MTWTIEPEIEGGEGREIVCGHTLIATVYGPANADLIAAAPDMLAALTAAAAYIDKCSYIDRAKWLAVRDTIETAINKANGVNQ